ncbi:hypothetical protein [Montanilutibacter psychrotolerans]|uniref:Uncharacterized protein n=1 Tax=Montanilutibacter psychrotolerans TaxID=1327343 RepID=A0A3M8SX10_9GAMM|nr:hypothetical protein [Lysobacter psychrotolerans]RNF83754.1 hypothetical protein EER27_10300 [Lysobacter psychrotolerans]
MLLLFYQGLPLLALVPAFVPFGRWFSRACLLFGALLASACGLASVELETMTSGEGPAFFGIAFYFTLVGAVFLAGFAAKMVAVNVIATARPATRKWVAVVMRALAALCLAFVLLACVVAAYGMAACAVTVAVLLAVLARDVLRGRGSNPSGDPGRGLPSRSPRRMG